MIARRALLTLPALLAARCAGPPPPAELTLTMVAGAGQNPDPKGRPTSVAVRLYQLAAKAGFERADVFALTEREAQTLGTEDLGSEEVVLTPGETRTITRTLKHGTRFIGVAVLFRDIDRAQWRNVTPVPASGPARRVLRIAAHSATLGEG